MPRRGEGGGDLEGGEAGSSARGRGAPEAGNLRKEKFIDMFLPPPRLQEAFESLGVKAGPWLCDPRAAAVPRVVAEFDCRRPEPLGRRPAGKTFYP